MKWFENKHLRLIYSQNKAHLKPFIVSGLNQAVSSAVNFLTAIYLVNTFNPEHFGIYGVGFAIIIFLGGISSSFFLTQMVVIYPSKSAQERKPFVSSVFILICIFCAGLLALSLFTYFLFRIYYSSIDFQPGLVLAITIAGIAYLLKEYYVRLAFNYRTEHVALYIHASILLSIIVLFLLEYRLNNNLTLILVFLIYALAHLIGILIGVVFIKINLGGFERNKLVPTVNELWKDGKWASISNIIYFSRIQAHTIITALLIGPAAVGLLNASRLLVTPATMTIPVISQMAIPRLSSIRERSKIEVINKGELIRVLLVSLSIIYSSLLLVFYQFISSYLLNEAYSNLLTTTILWCVYVLMLSIRNGGEMILQILQKFKFLSLSNLTSATVTILGAFLFGYWFDINGILIGLIIGELFLSLTLSNKVNKTKRELEFSL